MNEISVIVPCYNSETVLRRCLDSLVKQTIQITVIVVNDGSTDSTGSIIDEYQDRYGNIIPVTKKNEGLPQARRTGLKYVKTEYVGFLDSDDWVEKDTYEKLLKTIRREQADIVSAAFSFAYEDKKPVRMRQDCSLTVIDREQALAGLHERRFFYTFMWNKLYRSDLFNDNIIFPKGNFIGEDYVTIIQLVEHAERIALLDIPLFNYWQGNSSMSRGGFSDNRWISFREYSKMEEHLMSQYPLLKKDVHYYLGVEYLSFLVAMTRNNRYDAKMIKTVKKYIDEHFISIILSKGNSPVYKGSVVAARISPNLLFFICRFMK